jgi:hypothetical protein
LVNPVLASYDISYIFAGYHHREESFLLVSWICEESVVCANFAHATQYGAMEGKSQTSMLQLYNLDVISTNYDVK